MMTEASIQAAYNLVKRRAAEQSLTMQCTRHVAARIRVIHGLPQIVDFTISDWYSDDAHCTTFTYGVEKD